MEHEYTDILNIGKIFDVEEKAQTLVDEMKQEIEDALSKTKGKEVQTVSVIEIFEMIIFPIMVHLLCREI